MSNDNGDLMGNKIIKRDEECPLLTRKPKKIRGGNVTKGRHFRVNKSQPFQVRNFTKNKITCLYRSSFYIKVLGDKEEKF